jgi:hypothetical protein
MGTNCSSLLTELFLYSYEAVFIQRILHEKTKIFAVVLIHVHVFAINNDQFHLYVDSIYPSELINEQDAKGIS